MFLLLLWGQDCDSLTAPGETGKEPGRRALRPPHTQPPSRGDFRCVGRRPCSLVPRSAGGFVHLHELQLCPRVQSVNDPSPPGEEAHPSCDAELSRGPSGKGQRDRQVTGSLKAGPLSEPCLIAGIVPCKAGASVSNLLRERQRTEGLVPSGHLTREFPSPAAARIRAHLNPDLALARPVGGPCLPRAEPVEVSPFPRGASPGQSAQGPARGGCCALSW